MKRIFKAHQVHYEPFVRQLVAEAPLHLFEYPRISLPQERAKITMSVEEAITSRTSGRNFSSDPLPLDQLAALLYLGNAVRTAQGAGMEVFYQRNVPNSGNLGSVEIFPIIMNVAGVEPGIYHFDSVRHDLAQLRKGDFRVWLREQILFQLEFSEAAAALILTSAVGRLQSKYGLRGYRFALLDTGHVSDNIYLAGTGLGLQVCATAGFIDDELDAALGLDGLNISSMLVILVGATKKA
jgi:SagB-type dehydrogenase family enzyme